ncbi:U-box domain-containing protein 35 isoform X1 [Amborella trichopoda]|uniref:RING-type E3 ubiquitin transferase n=1 Tax=Amborella trichopoda TaxID=13333 RepID=W1PR88_AMBTC|nr:U-box domain-containing protein 35 isoform X1 [Amborella trichopoda]ERN12552.1 hypothetical protein AMTR_s00025p00206220 [Amborella trichopoda]|eukprot:XP_011625851.2 U-box domain-containing protein 35 isoform X1 [Amborella trichopoda]
MWNHRGGLEKKEGAHHHENEHEHEHEHVAVAIDKDKGSQYALKWAVDHLVTKGQTITLIHVKNKIQTVPTPMGNHVSISEVSEEVASAFREQMEAQIRELLMPFRCFCTRKDVHCKDAILEDSDVTKAIIDYVALESIDNLVLGASTRSSFLRRFKSHDIPTSISKGTPDFCTVYVISKGKLASVRSAVRPAPPPPLRNSSPRNHPITASNIPSPIHPIKVGAGHEQKRLGDHSDPIMSPFARGGRGSNPRLSENTMPESDISYVSHGKKSADRFYPASLYEHFESSRPPRLSSGAHSIEEDFNHNHSFESIHSGDHKSIDSASTAPEFSTVSQEMESRTSWSSQTMEDVEAEMKRLRLELKQTMDMYSSACKEALNAKNKARELHLWKMEEEHRLEEAMLAEEAARAVAEKEKAKCKAAMEAAEAAQRIAELESQKRRNAELKAQKETEEKKKALDALAHTDVRYRKYTIEEIETATDFFAEDRKIGEGGYGPVYKCYLEHTSVAIKVLRPDAAQGRMQFQQEVEVLSCIRHPNMVLLLGACPEYGCLVYEYMANGSLEDCLFRRGNSPSLTWQQRFRIAAEIGTALLFLHQTKPEPLVHRDLKPGNILLDHNYVSKISDVGLARLVPQNVANTVTQYRMTSTAGTFCYIDPEYQQTGMLGIKSDIYSLGIMLLQMISAKPPMGLTHYIERAIEKDTFKDMLDPTVPDWPEEEALSFAQLALKCSELRRKDRPDLTKVILPELNRLRALADESSPFTGRSNHASPHHSRPYIMQEVMSDPNFLHEDGGASRHSSGVFSTGRRTFHS